jgi:hypothetical protein
MAAGGITSGTSADSVACFCCGQLLSVGDITPFDQHPDQGVCARCAEWLHNRSKPRSVESSRPTWRRVKHRRWRRE